MCGIVGYIGKNQAAPIILDGLEKLEYRGYDSAGIAVCDGKDIQIRKSVGRLKVLVELTHGGEMLPGHMGIGECLLLSLFPVRTALSALMIITNSPQSM